MECVSSFLSAVSLVLRDCRGVTRTSGPHPDLHSSFAHRRLKEFGQRRVRVHRPLSSTRSNRKQTEYTGGVSVIFLLRPRLYGARICSPCSRAVLSKLTVLEFAIGRAFFCAPGKDKTATTENYTASRSWYYTESSISHLRPQQQLLLRLALGVGPSRVGRTAAATTSSTDTPSAGSFCSATQLLRDSLLFDGSSLDLLPDQVVVSCLSSS